MDDYISRQEAIDVCNYAIDLWHGQLGEGIVIAVRKKIAELPSEHPETCDTCKHGYFGDEQCNGCRVRFTSHYERRTDER